jgi:hypothetical protein
MDPQTHNNLILYIELWRPCHSTGAMHRAACGAVTWNLISCSADMHHLKNGTSAPYRLQCDYSSVGGALFRGEGSKPFYIPLRALLVGGAPNLLVAGKTMSQSFHASASTRLHPSEWTSGVAAGGTAVLMARRNWTTAQALAQVHEVQAFLNTTVVGQPLQFTGLPIADPPVAYHLRGT